MRTLLLMSLALLAVFTAACGDHRDTPASPETVIAEVFSGDCPDCCVDENGVNHCLDKNGNPIMVFYPGPDEILDMFYAAVGLDCPGSGDEFEAALYRGDVLLAINNNDNLGFWGKTYFFKDGSTPLTAISTEHWYGGTLNLAELINTVGHEGTHHRRGDECWACAPGDDYHSPGFWTEFDTCHAA